MWKPARSGTSPFSITLILLGAIARTVLFIQTRGRPPYFWPTIKDDRIPPVSYKPVRRFYVCVERKKVEEEEERKKREIERDGSDRENCIGMRRESEIKTYISEKRTRDKERWRRLPLIYS